MSEAFKPCPFCGGTNTHTNEMPYWTGERSRLIYASVRHWCGNKPHSGFIELKAPTHDEARALWNGRAALLQEKGG